MAFKKLTDYNHDRYANFFILRDDGDSANVTFLYHSIDDVLVADAHYINSADYTGYIHCCGRGCPACGAGIRVQKKLFIPLYSFDEHKILFFDRNTRFESVLQNQIFSRFPDPSKLVFQITRHGKANDVNTTYDITVVGRNKTPLEDILAQENMILPDGYDRVIKEFSAKQVAEMLNNRQPRGSYASGEELPDYTITPRGQQASAAPSASTNNFMNVPSASDDLEDNLPDFELADNSAASQASDSAVEELDDDVDF